MPINDKREIPKPLSENSSYLIDLFVLGRRRGNKHQSYIMSKCKNLFLIHQTLRGFFLKNSCLQS